MSPQPLEIYSAQIAFNLCNDRRPCIVLYPPSSESVFVALISSQPALFDRQYDFWIEPSHPDFFSTGLIKRSYVMGKHEYKINIAKLQKYYGRFEHVLAFEFKDWYGLQ